MRSLIGLSAMMVFLGGCNAEPTSSESATNLALDTVAPPPEPSPLPQPPTNSSERRVNDVDGATPAQRRWHIVQSDLKPRS